MQVLKVTTEKAQSPSRPRAKQEAGQGDGHKDSRHGNIARCRSRGRRDARRPRVIGTNRAIVPKFFLFLFFQTGFEVKYMDFPLRWTPSVLS